MCRNGKKKVFSYKEFGALPSYLRMAMLVLATVALCVGPARSIETISPPTVLAFASPVLSQTRPLNFPGRCQLRFALPKMLHSSLKRRAVGVLGTVAIAGESGDISKCPFASASVQVGDFSSTVELELGTIAYFVTKHEHSFTPTITYKHTAQHFKLSTIFWSFS